MIEKFDSKKHGGLISDMPFSYISTSTYLDFCAWVLTTNGEKLIVKQDGLYRRDFPSLFLPRDRRNWEFMSASMVTINDIKEVVRANVEVVTTRATETEFIYSTENLINPYTGHKRQINKFKNEYEYDIVNCYDKNKILKFNNFWKNQKPEQDNAFIVESNHFFHFCLNNLDRYGIQQVYVEIRGRLVGFVWGVRHSKDKWVNLHSRCDYRYRGLSQFLNREIAKRFSDTRICSLGTGCRNAGLIRYKKQLNPLEQKEYFYILTRGIK